MESITSRIAIQENGGKVHEPVGGIILEETGEKMTIYQAMKKHLLKPGTALALLEAQAATEGIIDPIGNRKLPVVEAVKQGIVGSEMKDKLLTAEKAISGYIDPYTNQIISVYQAMQKDVVPRDYGLRVLEAQIATKGIFDPVEKMSISTDAAIQKGLYEKALLSDQISGLNVFYNPSTQECLNYRDLMETCTVDPETGLLLLPVCIAFKGLRKGISSSELFESKIIDKETYEDLQKGKTTTQDVMLMETVKEYLEGKGSIAGISDLSTNQRLSIYQAMKKGILMPGTALVLLEAQAATGFMIDPVKNKQYTVDEAVNHKLVGPECHLKLLSAERAVTGYKDPYSGETISLFEAMSKELIVKEHGIRLLEAQIATGGIIDPINSHRLPTQVAFKRGYFDAEINKILEDEGDDTKAFFDPNTEENLTYLQLIERCVTDTGTGLCLLPLHGKSGKMNSSFIDYKTKTVFKTEKLKVTCGKYMGMTVSLWELLMSEYFNEGQRQDIFQSYKEGKLSITAIIETVLITIQTSVKTTKTVFEGIRETVTAKQLAEADIISEEVLEDLEKGKRSIKDVRTFYFFVDETTKLILKSTTTTKAEGKYKGTTVSLWDLLYSKYVTEEKRRDLVQQFKAGTLTIERFLEIILTMIQQHTTTTTISSTTTTVTKTNMKETTEDKTFKGIRKDVNLSELVESQIIDDKLYNNLITGNVTVAEVSEMDSVRKYLEGTNSIAGVYIQSTKETLSIYEAKGRGLLTPGTSLVLLEAQAATGFVIDPVNNKKLSVEEAVAKRLVGREWKDKLLSAERAVTGYKDPYTGNTISLFQALKKDLIVKDHGIRLLEAQIATGGIIDPVHSHRVPVQVAYQRGYFDEEMNQILSDAGDDTKGFFDPNTKENLTYLQLIERCITDPVTRFSLLLLKK